KGNSRQQRGGVGFRLLLSGGALVLQILECRRETIEIESDLALENRIAEERAASGRWNSLIRAARPMPQWAQTGVGLQRLDCCGKGASRRRGVHLKCSRIEQALRPNAVGPNCRHESTHMIVMNVRDGGTTHDRDPKR